MAHLRPAFLGGALAVAAMVTGGCSGESSGGSTTCDPSCVGAQCPPCDSGGSGGTGGGGGAVSTGGSAGTSGSPNQSPGSTTITFSVEDEGSYCRQDDGICGPGTPINVARVQGASLILDAGFCPTLCSDCVPQPCPGAACNPMGVLVSGATLTWNGAYYETGSCGGGTACVTPRYAAAGSYEATFCARRGSLDITPTGTTCVEISPPECVTVPFELPGSPVSAVLPSVGSGGTTGAGGSGSGGIIGYDPVCATADTQGLFPSCAACPTSNCDTIDTPQGSGVACGCSLDADCPCWFTCGCIEIAPGVNSCGMCVR